MTPGLEWMARIQNTKAMISIVTQIAISAGFQTTIKWLMRWKFCTYTERWKLRGWRRPKRWKTGRGRASGTTFPFSWSGSSASGTPGCRWFTPGIRSARSWGSGSRFCGRRRWDSARFCLWCTLVILGRGVLWLADKTAVRAQILSQDAVAWTHQHPKWTAARARSMTVCRARRAPTWKSRPNARAWSPCCLCFQSGPSSFCENSTKSLADHLRRRYGAHWGRGYSISEYLLPSRLKPWLFPRCLEMTHSVERWTCPYEYLHRPTSL